MNRNPIALSYDPKWLETERPQPLSDRKIEQLQQDVLSGKLDKDITDQVYVNFKQEAEDWILSSPFNILILLPSPFPPQYNSGLGAFFTVNRL